MNDLAWFFIGSWSQCGSVLLVSRLELLQNPYWFQTNPASWWKKTVSFSTSSAKTSCYSTTTTIITYFQTCIQFKTLESNLYIYTDYFQTCIQTKKTQPLKIIYTFPAGAPSATTTFAPFLVRFSQPLPQQRSTKKPLRFARPSNDVPVGHPERFMATGLRE